MLALDIQRNGRNVSVELPMNTNMLVGELRSIGIYEPLDKIIRADFLMQPTNELGEHFMRMVQIDDTLQAIAIASREFEVLEGDSRQALVDLIKENRLRDLDHMADYLQYGPDSLYGLIRMEYNGRDIVLPAPQRVLQDRFGSDKPMGEIRLAESELHPVSETGRQLMEAFQPYSDTVATANMACSIAQNLSDTTVAPAQIVEGARKIQAPMPTETMSFYCPLYVSQYDPDTEGYEPIDHVYLARNEDEIRATLDAWTNGKDETEFLDDGLQPKIASLGWEIELIGGELYGKAVCALRAPLTDSEMAELTRWLSEDTSDGLLDNFGEYSIKTGDGDLYVSFFQYDGENYMLPEDEFREQVLGEQSQDFCGMGGMA